MLSRILQLLFVSAEGFAPARGVASAAAAPAARAPAQTVTVQEVVVRGSRPQDEAREDRATASSVVTLDRTPRSGETVPQLLGEMPGVAVTRIGGLGSQALVSLRGSTWEQVLVYLDGIPLNAGVGGGLDLSTLPLGDVERIEVYRGMSPIAFGSSAIGGIVSITTRAPDRTAASGEVGAGSFGYYQGGASATWRGSRLRVYVGAHWQRARNDFLYPSNNGTAFDPSDDGDRPRQNNAFEQMDGTLRLMLPLPGRRELTLLGSVFDRQQGLAGYGVFSTKEVSLAGTRGLGSLAYRSRSDLGADSRLQGTAYVLHTRTRFHDLLGEIAYGPASTRDRTLTTGSTWTAQKGLGPIRLGLVLDGRFERFRPSDTEQDPPLGPPASRLFGAAGLEAITTLAPARVEVTPSVRAEFARDQVSGRTIFQDFVPASAPRNQLQPLARLSVVQRPAGWLALKANLGRYARLPNFTELYGNSGFVLGNPELRSESGWNADLGFTTRSRGQAWRILADAFAFGSLVGDLIQYQQGGNGVQRARNIGRARVMGLEGSVRLDHPYVRVLAQGTWTDARDRSDNTASRARQLPLRPVARGYVRPELRALPLPLVRGITWGAYGDVDATGGNYVDPANLVRMPGRLLLGAGVAVSSPRARWRVVVSAQNLTDSRVSDLAGYPLPGRAFFASLQAFTTPGPEGPAQSPTDEPRSDRP